MSDSDKKNIAIREMLNQIIEGKAAINARHRIKKKLKSFLHLEWPLLLDYQRKTSPLVETNEILKALKL